MPPSGEVPVADVHNTRVDQEGRSWVVRTLADGEWRAVSRHDDRERAEQARLALNASSPDRAASAPGT
jgi:hypothetical protein